MTAAPVDPTRCPLCGEPNRCANEIERATGVVQPACWCTNADFSVELLAQVPAEAQRLACVCEACASKSRS